MRRADVIEAPTAADDHLGPSNVEAASGQVSAVARRLVQLVAGLALVGAVLAVGVATARPALTPASVHNPIAARGCIIRFDRLNAAGTAVVPRIFQDRWHVCVGVTSVSVEPNGDLRIVNSGAGGPIVSAWALPDETMAADGLVCGVSGGGSVSIVRCYRPSGARIRFNRIADVYGAGSNLWFAAFTWIEP